MGIEYLKREGNLDKGDSKGAWDHAVVSPLAQSIKPLRMLLALESCAKFQELPAPPLLKPWLLSVLKAKEVVRGLENDLPTSIGECLASEMPVFLRYRVKLECITEGDPIRCGVHDLHNLQDLVKQRTQHEWNSVPVSVVLSDADQVLTVHWHDRSGTL